jgi:anti-sigma regulatory factor (Ser/Thr protein kinase)
VVEEDPRSKGQGVPGPRSTFRGSPVTWSGQALLSSLSEVAHLLEAWLRGIEGYRTFTREQYLVQLAVVEALTNIIRHAYPDRPGGEISVRLYEGKGSIEIEIEDRGIPFDLRGSCPADAEAVEEGGYGLFLIRKIAKGLCYTRKEDGRNCLLMSWDIPGGSMMKEG